LAKLSEAKILGGVGALLMLLLSASGIGLIIGLVLLFIAVRYIANESKDESIFDNYLMHFIFTIIAVVAVVVIFFASIGDLTFFTAAEEFLKNTTDPNAIFEFFQPYIWWWVIGGIVGWIFLVVSALYLKKSYNSISKHTGVGLFSTTGTVYLVGAISAIVLIGFIILFIAKIMEIIAFFSIPEKLPSTKVS
jgi:uncharacterized membrane protein